MGPHATIAVVKGAISAQTERRGHLRLVLPDGTLLGDCGMRVAELAEGPGVAGGTAMARSRSRSSAPLVQSWCTASLCSSRTVQLSGSQLQTLMQAESLWPCLGLIEVAAPSRVFTP